MRLVALRAAGNAARSLKMSCRLIPTLVAAAPSSVDPVVALSQSAHRHYRVEAIGRPLVLVQPLDGWSLERGEVASSVATVVAMGVQKSVSLSAAEATQGGCGVASAAGLAALRASIWWGNGDLFSVLDSYRPSATGAPPRSLAIGDSSPLGAYWKEMAHRPTIWDMPAMLRLAGRADAVPVTAAQCQFGSEYQKYTTFLCSRHAAASEGGNGDDDDGVWRR